MYFDNRCWVSRTHSGRQFSHPAGYRGRGGERSGTSRQFSWQFVREKESLRAWFAQRSDLRASSAQRVAPACLFDTCECRFSRFFFCKRATVKFDPGKNASFLMPRTRNGGRIWVSPTRAPEFASALYDRAYRDVSWMRLRYIRVKREYIINKVLQKKNIRKKAYLLPLK